MALKNKNLTIYGKGLQKKPFISLNDCIKSLLNFINCKKLKEKDVYNQYTHLAGIKDLAKLILKSKIISKNVGLTNIKNPRVENETHQMRMENKNFLKILRSKPESLNTTILKTIQLFDVIIDTFCSVR